jgi:hypothetical protein
MHAKIKTPKTLQASEAKKVQDKKGLKFEQMQGTSSSSGGVSTLRVSGHGRLPLVADEGGQLPRVEAATVDRKRWIHRCWSMSSEVGAAMACAREYTASEVCRRRHCVQAHLHQTDFIENNWQNIQWNYMKWLFIKRALNYYSTTTLNDIPLI